MFTKRESLHSCVGRRAWAVLPASSDGAPSIRTNPRDADDRSPDIPPLQNIITGGGASASGATAIR